MMTMLRGFTLQRTMAHIDTVDDGGPGGSPLV